MIWWEDFKVGERSEMGRPTFGEEEIVAFARQFDPQPFHVDPQAARESAFGGPIASGRHHWPVGSPAMVVPLRALPAPPTVVTPGRKIRKFSALRSDRGSV